MKIFNLLLFLALVCAVGLAAVEKSPFDLALEDRCGAKRCGYGRLYIRHAILKTHLRGSGFHKTLHYSASLICGRFVKPRPSCEVAFLQRLPPAIYANIYELDTAFAVNKGPKVQLYGALDVESIEKFAEPTAVAVQAPILLDTSGHHEASCGVVNVSFPLHGRYPRPTFPSAKFRGFASWKEWFEQDLIDIQLSAPAVLIRCPNRKHPETMDPWQLPGYVEASNNDEMIWQLPAGNLRLATSCAYITAVVVCLAATVLLDAVGKKPSGDENRRNKR